jgi:hypothetical protein
MRMTRPERGVRVVGALIVAVLVILAAMWLIALAAR